jgi:hypothetical protein
MFRTDIRAKPYAAIERWDRDRAKLSRAIFFSIDMLDPTREIG